jgi:hypothetical protein
MGETTMTSPALAFERTGRNSIDISKMMTGARLLAMSFSMGMTDAQKPRAGIGA